LEDRRLLALAVPAFDYIAGPGESNDTVNTADATGDRQIINGVLPSDADRDVFSFSTALLPSCLGSSS